MLELLVGVTRGDGAGTDSVVEEFVADSLIIIPQQLVKIVLKTTKSLLRPILLIRKSLRICEPINLLDVPGAAPLGHGVTRKGYAHLAVSQSAHLKVVEVSWQQGLLGLESLLVGAGVGKRKFEGGNVELEEGLL